MFSIRKCGDSECPVCKVPRLPTDVFKEIHHLPVPIPEGGRYKPFDELYGKVCSQL
jgi:hypothetical protein